MGIIHNKLGPKMPFVSLILLGFVALILVFWKFVFLRNPLRLTPEDPDVIISPADGKVIEVLEFSGTEIKLYKGQKRLLGLINTLTRDVAKNGYIVSIFMSPLDVHHNRSPIDGTIKSVVHTKGKFLPVNTFEAGLVNEKSETIIVGDKITLKMIQIAGFLATRVITHAKPGDSVDRGQVIGLINLGSQVTLIVPKNVKISVAKGDRVVAGETILAKINS